MKILKEDTDGFRWIDGNTSSAPFDKESEIYNEKLTEGYELVLLSQAEKDAHQAAQERSEFKLSRAQAVDAITVTTQAGNVFDGDETSQTRMARAIAVLDDGESTTWVLHDNTAILASKEELKEALKLAGLAQSQLWVMS